MVQTQAANKRTSEIDVLQEDTEEMCHAARTFSDSASKLKKKEEQKTWDPNINHDPTSLFNSEQCESFIVKMMPAIMQNDLGDMRFAVKKTLLPCLLAMGNQISYELFI